MPLRNQPVQRKIMTVILLTAAVVLLLMCSAYMVLEYYSYRANAKASIQSLSEVIAANSTAALAFESEKDAGELLNALKAVESVEAACLYKSDGRIFVRYPQNIQDSEFPRIISHASTYKFEGDFLLAFEPVYQQDVRLGTLFIRSSLKDVYMQLRQFALVGLMLIAGSLFIAFVLSQILQRSISLPILALEQTARVISDKGDYSVRARKHGNDEVGSLTDAFNLMLEQIQNQNREIRSFNTNLEKKVNERTNDLRQQKEFVETIINSSVDMISVFDKELNYIMVNKRVSEFYGKSISEIIGRKLTDVFPLTAESGMVDFLKKAIAGESMHVEKFYSPVLGRYIENFFIPLNDIYGNIYGVLHIGHDITNILEANAKLEKVNAELLKSNRDLEQFAYIASHDLQEPLRKIQTFTQLLAESNGNPERFRQYQEKIMQSASRMQQLIQDVLNFSRISNMQEAFVPTDLNQIIEHLKSDFELLIRERNVEIIYDKLPVVSGVPLQLTQLFSNLFSNSIKYSERDPSISISSRLIGKEEVADTLSLTGSNYYHEIKFIDNGIGFDPQYNEQIFAIFQRLHGRKTYSGTGIGLALCRKIAENHHGAIYADSRPGKGAVFTILLPADNFEAPVKEQKDVHSST